MKNKTTSKEKKDLKITAMICITLLGFVNLIGLYWGTQGFIFTLTSILIFIMLVLVIGMISSGVGEK